MTSLRADIAIVTVIKPEYDAMLAHLDEPERDPGTSEMPNLYAWQMGWIPKADGKGRYRVALAMVGRPRNASAALAVRSTVQRFHPRYVVLAGIAGGLPRENLAKGDVVVSEEIWGYEYGKLAAEFAPRQNFTYQVSIALLTAAKSLSAHWNGRIKINSPFGSLVSNALFGPVASGDKVVDDIENPFFKKVLDLWPKLLAVEMEGAGAAQAVQELAEGPDPPRFLMIRGVSDMPGSAGGDPSAVKQTEQRDRWTAYAAAAAAAFTTHLIATAWPVPPSQSADYPDDETDRLTRQLENTYARRNKLRSIGQRTADLDREIAGLKHRLRQGGQLRAGDTLSDDRYLLIESIGQGGFGIVWHALDCRRNASVAIKVLHSNLAGDPIRRDRFFRGARVMAELAAPAVARIIEPRGEDAGWLYYVMEFISGGDLRRFVNKERPAQKNVLSLILQIGDTLANAHSKDIVHRDVKPANILMDDSGKPKLTDFDLVAVAESKGGTRTGALGTFVYAAPEMMDRPQDADARADVYGLGMTAVFCLYGRELPSDVFRNADMFIERLSCDTAIKAVLRKAVSWKKEERFDHAGAFCAALRAALPQPLPEPQEPPVPSPWQAPPGPPVRRARRLWLGAVVAVAALIGGSVIGLKTCDKQTPVEPSVTGLTTNPSATAVPSASAPTVPATAAVPQPGPCTEGMSLIEGGPFSMGSDKGDSDEKPVHPVTVPSFCLDQTEVTVQAYAACVQTGPCTAAQTTVDWPGITQADRDLWKRFCNGNRDDRQTHPINCVDFTQAEAYCKAKDKRLPTEREWEYAARGGNEQREYPWGGDKLPGPKLLNACGSECVARGKELGQTWASMYPQSDGFAETAPVKSFEEGKGRWEVYDLAGNVWEWTSSWYCAYPNDGSKKCAEERRVVRGGGWDSYGPSGVRAAYRVRYAPPERFNDVGFRCARTL